MDALKSTPAPSRTDAPARPPDEAPEAAGAISGWKEAAHRLDETAAAAGAAAAAEEALALARAHPRSTDCLLLAGKHLQQAGRPREALQRFEAASRLALRGALTWRHPLTRFLVLAQLEVERSDLPCRSRCEANLQANLRAIAELDAALAAEIAGSGDSGAARVVDVWGNLTLAGTATRKIAILQEEFAESVQALLPTRTPVAFHGAGSGFEIRHLLDHPPRLPLGETRVHYLFERDAPALKEFLRMADLSIPLHERRLVIFGGRGWEESARRLFSTGRYPPPKFFFGDGAPYRAGSESIGIWADASPELAGEVSEYYRSPAFQERLREVAAGRRLPAILLLSCRWTTVLRHVCEQFRRGFEELGCKTEIILEETDVESLSRKVYYEALARLRPEVVFHVSHGRPSCNRLPPELPILCFFMDRCGKILQLPAIGGLIQPADLFFCIFSEFSRYLEGKGVPREQLLVMPTPADEDIFHPLPEDDPGKARFAAEVSFVKHGSPDSNACLERMFAEELRDPRDPLHGLARRIYKDIHRRILADRRRQWFEGEAFQLAAACIPAGSPEDWGERLRALTTRYMVTVYSPSYRQHFLEPLLASGLDFKLYGRGWKEHPLFESAAQGPVERKEELNIIYNASAINLHIHHEASMHQRLAEGALAGGFFMANRLDPARNWEPLDGHFEEGREVVLFDSAEDLLDRCRYYLEHAPERRQIAERMRARALRDLTLRQGSDRILCAYRRRLAALLEAGNA